MRFSPVSDLIFDPNLKILKKISVDYRTEDSDNEFLGALFREIGLFYFLGDLGALFCLKTGQNRAKNVFYVYIFDPKLSGKSRQSDSTFVDKNRFCM